MDKIRMIVSLLLLAACAACASQRTPTSPLPEAATSAPVSTHTPPPSLTATLAPSATELPPPTATPIPTQTFTASPSPLPTIGAGSVLKSRVDLRPMAFIPAGDFPMGAAEGDEQADADEKPLHSVNLDAFWIDLYEVTNQDYTRCVAAGACPTPAARDHDGVASPYADPAFARHPVVNVSWENAQEYCAWAEKRLPTEAQWQKAARGSESSLYAWGDQPPAAAYSNLQEALTQDGYETTTPVGSFAAGASPYGVFDLTGNVQEWVSDWYGGDFYSQPEALDNPSDPASGTYRLYHGGSFASGAKEARTSFRAGAAETSTWHTVGFRCALDDTRELLLYEGQPTLTPTPTNTPVPSATPTSTPLPGHWALTLADANKAKMAASAIQPLPDGSLVIAGGIGDPAQLWVMRLNPDHSLAWQGKVDGFSGAALEMSVTPDEHLIIATTTKDKDLGLVKLDLQGKILFQNSYGGAGIERNATATATADGIWLAGVSSSNTKGSLLVYRLTPGGEVSWQKAYAFGEDAPKWDSAQAQSLADGSLVVWGKTSYDGGFAFLKIARDGSVTDHRSYTWGWGGISYASLTFDVSVTALEYLPGDGSLIIAGITKGLQGPGPTWVIKLDSSGQFTWQKMFSQPVIVLDIQNSATGIVLSGVWGQTKQPWIGMLNPYGAWLWQNIFDNGKTGQLNAVLQEAIVLEDGQVLAAGNAYCSDAGPDCALLLKLDAAGRLAGCGALIPSAAQLTSYKSAPFVVQDSETSVTETKYMGINAVSTLKKLTTMLTQVCLAP